MVTFMEAPNSLVHIFRNLRISNFGSKKQKRITIPFRFLSLLS